MKLTIAFTVILIVASIVVGRGSGEAGQDPLLPPAEESNQDVLRLAPYSSSWTTPPSLSTPAPHATHTPFTETSSIQITPQPPHSHEESAPTGSIEALVCSMPWPCSEALSVMYCESGGDPDAYNPGGGSGLFQLVMPLHSWRLAGGNVYRAEDNIRAAFSLWSEQGWTPWRSCR